MFSLFMRGNYTLWRGFDGFHCCIKLYHQPAESFFLCTFLASTYENQFTEASKQDVFAGPWLDFLDFLRLGLIPWAASHKFLLCRLFD